MKLSVSLMAVLATLALAVPHPKKGNGQGATVQNTGNSGFSDPGVSKGSPTIGGTRRDFGSGGFSDPGVSKGSPVIGGTKREAKGGSFFSDPGVSKGSPVIGGTK